MTTPINTPNELLAQLENKALNFSDVLEFISTQYDFTATAFKNGNAENAATENQGSCRVFAFAKLNGLNKAQTLSLFAEHYQNVLDTPAGNNHQNIRQFQQHGWAGVSFASEPLQAK